MSGDADARTDLYVLRHAESVGNATGDYDTSQSGELSERGREQARDLVDALAGFEFDRVVTSPYVRARETVLPYLRETGRVAEVWPELAEGCHHPEHDGSPVETVRYGDPVDLPDADARHLEVVTDAHDARYPPADETYAEGLARVREAQARLLRDCAGESALVACHGHAGSRVVELTLGVEPRGRFHGDNAGMTHVAVEGESVRLSYFDRLLTEPFP
ncbi:MAG: histidine phosphatase family protein [Halobacteriaceae archaeon]